MGTDVADVLGSPIGQPMATVSTWSLFCHVPLLKEEFQILFNSFGKRGTLAIWSFIIVSQLVNLIYLYRS